MFRDNAYLNVGDGPSVVALRFFFGGIVKAVLMWIRSWLMCGCYYCISPFFFIVIVSRVIFSARERYSTVRIFFQLINRGLIHG